MSALTAAVRAVTPPWLVDRIRVTKLTRLARRLATERDRLAGADQVLDCAFRGPFKPNQVHSEIRALLADVERLRPRRVLEIGSQGGGTLFLFASLAAPDARIMAIDLNLSQAQSAAYPLLARSGQRISCLAADSHAAETLVRVKDWLNGDALDFLFIDGDHSFAGVKADFEVYGPLVRKGGLIAFHDIVPDHTRRYGKRTPADSGEVPRYWQTVRLQHPGYRELIDDPEQDGAGLGLIVR